MPKQTHLFKTNSYHKRERNKHKTKKLMFAVAHMYLQQQLSLFVFHMEKRHCGFFLNTNLYHKGERNKHKTKKLMIAIAHFCNKYFPYLSFTWGNGIVASHMWGLK